MISLAMGMATYTKSNNTYNTSSILTINASFMFNITTADIVTLYVPQGLFLFVNNYLTLSSQVAATVVSNSTYQSISFTPLQTSNNLNVTFQIINPSTTMQLNNMILTTFRNGYNSQNITFTIAPCDPLYLAVIASSSDRNTGDMTNLTFTFNRNINSMNVIFTLPQNDWNYSNSTYSTNQPLLNLTSITMNSSLSTIITFFNLTNKADISPSSNLIGINGIDSLGNSV
jgi:hypothetical protein